MHPGRCLLVSAHVNLLLRFPWITPGVSPVITTALLGSCCAAAEDKHTTTIISTTAAIITVLPCANKLNELMQWMSNKDLRFFC
jgi:hypothetical protein